MYVKNLQKKSTNKLAKKNQLSGDKNKKIRYYRRTVAAIV